MRAVVSSLTVRFYKRDGWTQEILNECVKWSPIPTREMIAVIQSAFSIPHPDDEDPYFVYRGIKYAQLDLDKLMGHVTELDRRSFNDYPEVDDKEFIKRRLL